MCTQVYTYIRIDIFYNIVLPIYTFILQENSVLCVPLVRAQHDITTHLFLECSAEELKQLLYGQY